MVLAAVLAACLVWTRNASAQDHAAPPWSGKRTFAVEVGSGFNAPGGVLSVAVDVALFRYLSLAAGVGYGDGSAHYSTMARIRIPLGRTSVGVLVHNLGLGWSTGRHTTGLDTPPCEYSECPTLHKIWDPAHRFDAEYSIEFPLIASTLVLRLYGGVSTIINSGNYVCGLDPLGYNVADQYQCRGHDASAGNVFPYFGVALAMLFGASDRPIPSRSFAE